MCLGHQAYSFDTNHSLALALGCHWKSFIFDPPRSRNRIFSTKLFWERMADSHHHPIYGTSIIRIQISHEKAKHSLVSESSGTHMLQDWFRPFPVPVKKYAKIMKQLWASRHVAEAPTTHVSADSCRDRPVVWSKEFGSQVSQQPGGEIETDCDVRNSSMFHVYMISMDPVCSIDMWHEHADVVGVNF